MTFVVVPQENNLLSLWGLYFFLHITFDKSKIFVPPNVAVWCCRHEHLNELAVFLQFKRVYRTGHFHSHKVPQSLYLSRPTFRKYIDKFVALNWCEKVGRGFRLKSIRIIGNKIAEDSSYNFTTIISLPNGTKSEIVARLRGLALHNGLRQKQFMESAKRQDITQIRENKVKKEINKGLVETTQYGTKAIGRTFNRSKSTGHRVKMQLIKMKQLQRWKVKPKRVYDFEVGTFVIKGKIYKRQCDMIKYGLVKPDYSEKTTGFLKEMGNFLKAKEGMKWLSSDSVKAMVN